MNRVINILDNRELEIKINKSNQNPTWYFVHWNNDEKDEEGNYTIYTHNSTFGEQIPVFKSKNWEEVCATGNLINGLFHKYLNIPARPRL